MLQIGKAIVSFDVVSSNFSCNLSKCKGACCVHGDSGAPLEPDEVKTLAEIYPSVKPYLSSKSIDAIDNQGTSVIDADHDTVTPLVEGKECAYVYFENEIAKCAIELAYFDKKIAFRKPLSCHLYPIRITRYKNFEAVNYHHWEICKPAIDEGIKNSVQVYNFLKEPLRRKYGTEWFEELKIAAEMFEKDSQSKGTENPM